MPYDLTIQYKVNTEHFQQVADAMERLSLRGYWTDSGRYIFGAGDRTSTWHDQWPVRAKEKKPCPMR